MDLSYGQAVSALPSRLRTLALSLPPEEQSRAEELRLRVGQPLTVRLPEREVRPGGAPVEPEELERLVEIASRASVHTVMAQLGQGYLTLAGGHRVGLCGTVGAGAAAFFQRLSSANIRIARQIPGAAEPVLGELCPGGRLTDTLILSPPGAGKTTLLRDVIRRVSQGEGCRPLQVALVDQRGEVAALWEGRPQLDVGCRTDVLEGCSKAEGLMLLLRAMGPQVLAVDELTAPEDLEALAVAAGCGVTLLATAHGAGREDLERRPLYRELLAAGLFRRLVVIGLEGGGRRYTVEELK